MRIVLVDWLDSASPADTCAQFSSEDAEEIHLLPITEVGFWIRENNQELVIASFMSEEKQFRHIRIIPKACVTKMKTIGKI